MKVKEERDILKKAAAYFAKDLQVKYAFMRANREEFDLKRMCQVLQVSRSGFYEWVGGESRAQSTGPCSTQGSEPKGIKSALQSFISWTTSGTNGNIGDEYSLAGVGNSDFI